MGVDLGVTGRGPNKNDEGNKHNIRVFKLKSGRLHWAILKDIVS